MKTLILVILLCAAVYSQIQITDMSGINCTNFTSLPFPNIHGYYAFEAGGTSGSDIYIGKYNGALNTFTTLQKINYIETENKYPNLFMKNDTLYIVYQSVVNNYSRIVYRTYINNTVSDLKVISGSLIICTQPKLMLYEAPYNDDTAYVYFQTNNSVYFKNIQSDDPPLEIFSGDMDVQFSSPSFVMRQDGIIYAAARWKGFTTPGYFITLKKRVGNQWGDGNGQNLFSGKEFDNIRFVKVNYNAMLSWDTDDNTRKDIYIMPSIEDTNSVLKLRDNYPYSNYDFHADQNYIVTDNDEMPVMYTNAFKIMMGNLLYIRVNKDDEVFNSPDSLIFTSINNTSLYVGSLGMSPEGAVFYTVWEANSDNTNQLFGRRSIEHITGINDNESKYDFTLKQNFPNPFNPSTKIKWIMNTGSNVKVVIYDMLSKEVQVLLNEYRQPGVNEINFNASGLSSGVYFYKITAGNFSSVRKMVYLK